MQRPFHGDAIYGELCEHMRPAVAWLRDAHALTPERAELDIKANTLSVDYDARFWTLTPDALAAAQPGSTLDIHPGGFMCRDCWQTASATTPRDG